MRHRKLWDFVAFASAPEQRIRGSAHDIGRRRFRMMGQRLRLAGHYAEAAPVFRAGIFFWNETYLGSYLQEVPRNENLDLADEGVGVKDGLGGREESSTSRISRTEAAATISSHVFPLGGRMMSATFCA